MENTIAYEQAKRRAAAKLSFLFHLAVYIVVNLLLMTINLVTSSSHLWFIWPLMGWGIGLIFHGLGVVLFNGGMNIKERMIRRELEKAASIKGTSAP